MDKNDLGVRLVRKVLYLQWDCFGEEYICDSFKRAGIVVEMYPLPYGSVSMRHDEEFESELTVHISASAYEFVFSFNQLLFDNSVEPIVIPIINNKQSIIKTLFWVT